MALRLGIGDTLTLCKGAIDYCSRTIHDEPEDARILVADMCLMRSHLQCLSKQLGNEKEFMTSRPDIAPAIQKSLAPINRDLSELKKKLHECNGKRKPSLHIVDRVRYHVLYKPTLDSFRQKIPAHRKSISEMETLIEAKTHSERRASIVRLHSLAEEQDGSQKRGEEDEICRREMLGLLEERYGIVKDERWSGDILDRLRDDLVGRGHDEGKVEEQLEEVKRAFIIDSATVQPERFKGPEALQLETFKF